MKEDGTPTLNAFNEWLNSIPEPPIPDDIARKFVAYFRSHRVFPLESQNFGLTAALQEILSEAGIETYVTPTRVEAIYEGGHMWQTAFIVDVGWKLSPGTSGGSFTVEPKG